jgi:hypothetical protein
MHAVKRATAKSVCIVGSKNGLQKRSKEPLEESRANDA